VPFPVLQAIAEVPEDMLRRGLATLQAGEFLLEARLFPDLEYTFKHALTHEVAYGSLLQERRRAIHARIVEAIEALYAGRLAEHVERLAHHATQDEVWAKAVDYRRQAGAKAFAASANRESVTCFEQALDALAHLPETRETAEQGIDLRFDLRNALFLLGEYERVDERIREANGLARTLNDSRRFGWVSVYMSLNRFLVDDPIQQRVSAEHALAIAEKLADVRLQVAANCLLGAAHLDSGEYRQADAVFHTVVASVDQELTRDHCGLHIFPAVFSRIYGARALAECRAFEQGIGYGKDALRIAESLGHSSSLIQTFRHVGYLYALKGEFDQAADLLERGLILARQEGNIPAREIQFTQPLGNAYARLGRVTEGLTLLRQALQAREAMGSEGEGLYYSLFLVDLGQAYVLAN
jgi:tetratricopeptide (TPR) repeat protein